MSLRLKKDAEKITQLKLQQKKPCWFSLAFPFPPFFLAMGRSSLWPQSDTFIPPMHWSSSDIIKIRTWLIHLGDLFVLLVCIYSVQCNTDILLILLVYATLWDYNIYQAPLGVSKHANALIFDFIKGVIPLSLSVVLYLDWFELEGLYIE